jgi:excisionase family DNA binding protein
MLQPRSSVGRLVTFARFLRQSSNELTTVRTAVSPGLGARRLLLRHSEEAKMPAPETSDPLWDMDEVSTYLKVPKRTLYRWRTHNYGPRGIRVGRHVRYRQSAVIEWVDRMERSDDE